MNHGLNAEENNRNVSFSHVRRTVSFAHFPFSCSCRTFHPYLHLFLHNSIV